MAFVSIYTVGALRRDGSSVSSLAIGQIPEVVGDKRHLDNGWCLSPFFNKRAMYLIALLGNLLFYRRYLLMTVHSYSYMSPPFLYLM